MRIRIQLPNHRIWRSIYNPYIYRSIRPYTVTNAKSKVIGRNNIDIHNLPSESDARRSNVSKWFSDKMDNLQATIFTAGQTLNDFTGYSAIEQLKKSIEDQELLLGHLRQQVTKHKEQYTDAITKRSTTQREVNELLQRKHAWSQDDLERFTKLYRNDHENEHQEQVSQEELTRAEQEFEDCRARLSRLISARYREEQIWSDKIRRASTWGTWVLMVFNVVLFVVVQLGLEPWKRKRLVGSFEDKVKEAITQNSTLIDYQEILQRLEQSSRIVQEYEVKTKNSKSISEEYNYSWSNFAQRVTNSIASSVMILIRPVEFLSSIAGAAGCGMILGSLITLALI